MTPCISIMQRCEGLVQWAGQIKQGIEAMGVEGAKHELEVLGLQAGKDLGFLMNPGDGAVTAVEFYTPAGTSQPTHLLSGAADGSISVWGAGGSWECLKVLKGHK
jgi:protein MAK11